MMSAGHFKDYFSEQSKQYLKFRPLYPDALYDYLAELSPSRQLAWDCATGNGQCAQGLSTRFKQVIASDASALQIRHAKQINNIEYRLMSAEDTDIAEQSVDLITVAQALHWFDISAFFKQAQRVLKDQGIISVWSYSLLSVNREIDQIIHDFYHLQLADYWPAERKLVEKAYQDIDFPFMPVEPRMFNMTEYWTLNELTGYLDTWSAVQAYRHSLEQDPLLEIRDELNNAWGDAKQSRKISWPLSVITGRHKIHVAID